MGGGTHGDGEKNGGSRPQRLPPEGRHGHDPEQRTGTRASPKAIANTRGFEPLREGKVCAIARDEANACPGGGEREEICEGRTGAHRHMEWFEAPQRVGRG